MKKMKKKIDKQILKNLELENQFHSVDNKKNQIVLSLDYGEKFCGLAWSPDGFMIFPIGVISTENIIGEMQTIIKNRKVSHLILGLPISSDGGENEICQKIRQLGDKFKSLLPVEFVNERFSSQSVISSENDRIDDLAAAKILQFYLAKK